jgi:hypothetical protein
MEQQVNLYQPILGAEKRLFSAHTIGVALAALALCLIGVAGFARWRTTRIERAVVTVSQQETQALALAARANAANQPGTSLADLDAQARHSTEEIAAREYALNIVRRGSGDAHSGFAARLEAIGRRQVEGVWLTSLVMATGDSRLAFSGAATDARLISGWLASLEEESALNGAYFDKVSIKQVADAAPAAALFEIGAPGLELAAAGSGK